MTIAGFTIVPAFAAHSILAHETKSLLSDSTAIASAWPESKDTGKLAAQAQVEVIIEELQQLVELTHCADAAVVYLSTNATLDLNGAGLLTLEISGNIGQQQFTFFSGTTQPNIVAAINTFTDETGVVTSQCLANNDRVEIRSTILGSQGWVRAEQMNTLKYNYNLLSDTPTELVSTSDLKDIGFDGILGDVDCDSYVNQVDLALIIEHWGACSQNEFCPADLSGNGTVDVDDLLKVINHWTQFD